MTVFLFQSSRHCRHRGSFVRRFRGVSPPLPPPPPPSSSRSKSRIYWTVAPPRRSHHRRYRRLRRQRRLVCPRHRAFFATSSPTRGEGMKRWHPPRFYNVPAFSIEVNYRRRRPSSFFSSTFILQRASLTALRPLFSPFDNDGVNSSACGGDSSAFRPRSTA
jgi:hypothetical protein